MTALKKPRGGAGLGVESKYGLLRQILLEECVYFAVGGSGAVELD